MPTIALTAVRKSYGTHPPAIDNLDLEIPDGSFTCLLGPSGCGKTTTLRMIAGLEPLDAGSIEVGGRIRDSVERGVFVPPEERGMGLVFQNYALWPHLTVARNVEFGLRVRKVRATERAERTMKALKMMQIDWAADRYPAQLSGGQQQRVSLARMLVINPEVLLLDEPLSNLDAQLRLEMRAELKRLHDETGHTIVFVTHDQLEAMTMATHVVVMNKGEVQQLAPPLEIYHRPANTFVAQFVGSPPMNLFDVGTDESGPFRGAVHDRIVAERPELNGALRTVGVRPEAIRLSARSAAADSPPGGLLEFDATVTTVLPTGSSTTVSLDAAGTELYLVSFQPVTATPGDTARCSIDLTDLHLFDGARARLPEPSAARPSKENTAP
ncbi:ABC transporter ATP-binding protein [Streptomyces lancefieldiae]|uniref:ABC transporter ATP-binding protein n=1 Tax=Streptomyces lancefieldiae TaxID=3075520 RepID=A0ABU3AGK8_9ACTN|nr:ABC transporter ATP-binding protein [Streptomyces sp. DSM 40712]MDT0609104.1 ABC transporter ATP-binding protein [Streptomyces sp. DSM 40712]